jgi:membrane-associated protease RseP (regulator of RpoE activity)
MQEVFEQWRTGQQLVLTGIESASGERTAGLTFKDAYWERYRHGPPTHAEEFQLVWVRAVVPADQAERMVRRFSSGVKLAGITAVAPFPLIAWRGGDVRGAMVRRVADDSAGARAKLGPGDLIQAVGDKRVRRLSDLEPALAPAVAAAKKTGEPLVLTVRRPGEGTIKVEMKFPRPRSTKPVKRAPTEIDE